MPTSNAVTVEVLSPISFEPFGWVLGKSHPLKKDAVGFRSPASDFWHEHFFDPGMGGDTEVLWVKYRDNNPLVSKLEVHHMTQQAVVPLTSDIVQVLCLSDENRTPDLSTLRAYHLSPGVGICMRPGVWHATRADDATCLMLTRRSTTEDLIDHLINERPAKESAILEIPPIRLLRTEADR
ncbi:ureidoglycolate lyase [Nitrobacteraceae bacterium AZCC 2146]